MNVFIALKESHFWFLFQEYLIIISLDVVSYDK